MKTISPVEAARLCANGGAVLVDVREPDEHARQKIDGAVSLPLSSWDGGQLDAGPIIYHCRSGARTEAQASRLRQKAGDCEWFVLEGGLDGWRRAGLGPQPDDRGADRGAGRGPGASPWLNRSWKARPAA